MNPLLLELVRQVMRWGALWLVTIGLPPSVAALLEHPEVISFVAGLVMYAVADTGWLASFWRRVRGVK